ncbi:MAG: hypothetical protein JSR45_03870 [Proteobacteria bacterium]|nr:hypothetical protein [Pseudomonadota bacterium]
MPQSIYGQILFAFIVGACLLAFWKGETPERRTGALLLVSTILAFAVQHQADASIKPYLVFAVELFSFVGLGLIAWTSSKTWPIWAASFQTISLSVVIARMAGLHIMASAYVTAVNLAAYGLIGSLIVGTVIVWREREALKSFQTPG